MTTIRCEAYWCKFNTAFEKENDREGECLNENIELTWDTYEQFWCKSNKQEEKQ